MSLSNTATPIYYGKFRQDVIDGKAIYQETQVITGNDTIKTYDIVWKQKN